MTEYWKTSKKWRRNTCRERDSEIKQSGYKEERGNTLAYFILNKLNWDHNYCLAVIPRSISEMVTKSSPQRIIKEEIINFVFLGQSHCKLFKLTSLQPPVIIKVQKITKSTAFDFWWSMFHLSRKKARSLWHAWQSSNKHMTGATMLPLNIELFIMCLI